MAEELNKDGLNQSNDLQDQQQQKTDDQRDQQDVIEFEIDEHIANAMEKFGYTEEDIQNMPPELAKKTINVLKSYVHAEKKMHEVTNKPNSQFDLFNQQVNQQQSNMQLPNQNIQQQQQGLGINPDDWDPYDFNKFVKAVQEAAKQAVLPVVEQITVQQQIQQIVTDFKSRHPEVPDQFIPTIADVAVKHGFNNLDDAYNFMRQAFGGGTQQQQMQQTQQQQMNTVKKIIIPTRPNQEGNANMNQNVEEIPESQKDVFEYLNKKFQ